MMAVELKPQNQDWKVTPIKILSVNSGFAAQKSFD